MVAREGYRKTPVCLSVPHYTNSKKAYSVKMGANF